LAGNIGDSFAKQIVEKNYENYVLEISSFQLDGIETFKPKIAVITNITPDHLDRYEHQFENYIASKFRITINQTKDDFFIYDADDEGIARGLKKHKTDATMVPFSMEKELEFGAYVKNDEIITTINKDKFKGESKVTAKVSDYLDEFETAEETFRFVDISTKRSKYNRDIDEAFYKLAVKYIEKLAKLVVLTNAHEMSHLHHYRQVILKHKQDIHETYMKIKDITL